MKLTNYGIHIHMKNHSKTKATQSPMTQQMCVDKYLKSFNNEHCSDQTYQQITQNATNTFNIFCI